MTFDAVLSVHTNQLTCGTAKFSMLLAEKLGVPFDSLSVTWTCRYKHPLLSLRYGELPRVGDEIFAHWPLHFSVLWHDRFPGQAEINDRAEQVWYADELGAPSTLTAHKKRRGEIHVLTFGMSHKRQQGHLERMKALLEATGRSYTVGVSTAIHEGSPWASAWAESDQALRAIFGDHLRQYGFLADDGLANAIQDASHVALFYDPAVRRNNTTLWAALEQKAIVITNLDADSPPELLDGVHVYDINHLHYWPDQASDRRTIRSAIGTLVRGRYSWEHLLNALAPAYDYDY